MILAIVSKNPSAQQVLLGYCQKKGKWGIDQGHYFTKRLSGQYPREIVELYWKETATYVKMGKEANRY